LQARVSRHVQLDEPYITLVRKLTFRSATPLDVSCSEKKIPPVDRELRRSEPAVSATSKDASSEATDDKKTKRSRKTRRSEDAPGLRKETIEHPVSERVRRCPH
jgi:hypothetical protein